MSAWQYQQTSAIDMPKSVIESARPRSRAKSRRLMRKMCYGIGLTTVARRTTTIDAQKVLWNRPHPIHIDCCDTPLHAGRQTTGDGRIWCDSPCFRRDLTARHGGRDDELTAHACLRRARALRRIFRCGRRVPVVMPSLLRRNRRRHCVASSLSSGRSRACSCRSSSPNRRQRRRPFEPCSSRRRPVTGTIRSRPACRCSGSRRRPTTSSWSTARTRAFSPRQTSRPSTCSSCSRPREWCGPRRPNARRWRATSPVARASSRSTTPQTWASRTSTRGGTRPSTAAHTCRNTPPACCPAPPSSRTRSTRRRPACLTVGTAARSGTTSTATPAATSMSWSPRTSARTTRARAPWGRTTPSPGAATAVAAACGPPPWGTAARPTARPISATTSSGASSGRPARSPATAAAPCGATSRSAPSTTTPRTRWPSRSPRTGGCSTSSGAGR